MSSEFVSRLRAVKVHGAATPAPLALVFGLVLWGVPASLYVAQAVVTTAPVPRALWIANVGLHTFVGVLVAADARGPGGTFWPLQVLVIGVATYVTLTLPALAASAMRADDDALVALAFVTLFFVCVADATMVAILFEYVHRSLIALSR